MQTNLPPRNRWQLAADGGIDWCVTNDAGLPHVDRVELCGFKVAAVVHYGARANGLLVLRKDVIWPALRFFPNDTHASLARSYNEGAVLRLAVDGNLVLWEKLVRARFDGTLTLDTETPEGLAIRREIFPADRQPAVIERYTITNRAGRPLTVRVASNNFTEETDAALGVYGAYTLSAAPDGAGEFSLSAGESMTAAFIISGRRAGEPAPVIDAGAELRKRRALQTTLRGTLALETPDAAVNEMFALAKFHAAESIFATKGGLMHAPGGGLGTETSVPCRGRYYAAVWANDQIEYAAPFFAGLNYAPGREATENAFRMFAKFSNSEWRSVPSSVIAEGDDIWSSAGDRGDTAMLAYGLGRYALTLGDRAVAEQWWPFLEWCLEYCRRKVNADGVVASDSDELEGRLPAGDANLHTSVLVYDALRSAAALARDLGRPVTVSDEYARRAEELRRAIEQFFGAEVEGFATYRYYRENTVLRAWICSPLTVGLFARKDATISALVSPKLWTADGVLSASNQADFWDRATLYALRGIFYAGAADLALGYLRAFTARRLLGDHVPYAVEAQSPTQVEAAQCHLAAESALYVRVFTEGLLGLRPAGLRAFWLKPSLPVTWPRAALRNLNAFGHTFDLQVERAADGALRVVIVSGDVSAEHIIRAGDELEVEFAGETLGMRKLLGSLA
ncbi:MAG: hypothetical protein LBK60_09995 [Verrucomicrobiales bacterium]|jgi:hypothetical protein|nr:hypothetical protein [Verrucomicrobiales bacterium]